MNDTYTLTIQNPQAAQNALVALQADPSLTNVALDGSQLTWQKAPVGCVVHFHYQNYTLTTAVSNPRPQKCECGKRLAVGEAVSMISTGPYRAARARRLCLPCALNKLTLLALPTFRQLTSKNHPYFVECECGEGPIAKADVLAAFATAYH